MTKKIIIGVALLLCVALGVWATRWYYQSLAIKVQEDSQVLLQQIQQVYKLTAVEGYFSEVYDYSDYWGYDLSIFRRKALIRVKAKVSVGYDMEKVTFDSDPLNKTIYIRNLPEPTILSIDHDLDYYDITEGVFNSFTADDYTKISGKAKAYIQDQALKSPLLENARQQREKMFAALRVMIDNAGWKLVVEDAPKRAEGAANN